MLMMKHLKLGQQNKKLVGQNCTLGQVEANQNQTNGVPETVMYVTKERLNRSANSQDLAHAQPHPKRFFVGRV